MLELLLSQDAAFREQPAPHMLENVFHQVDCLLRAVFIDGDVVDLSRDASKILNYVEEIFGLYEVRNWVYWP